MPPPASGATMFCVSFDIECDAKPNQDTVVVTGSDPVAGSWNPQNSRIVLKPTGGQRKWTGAMSIPPGATLEFKVVVLTSSGPKWEEGIPNRKIGPARFSIKYAAKFNAAGVAEAADGALSATQAGELPAVSPARTTDAPPCDVHRGRSPSSSSTGPEAAVHSRAVKRREELLASIAAGDAAAKKAKEQAVAGSQMEAGGYEKLCAHRTGLQSLIAELLAQSADAAAKVAEQQAAARCLEEELAAVSKAGAAARVRIESVRRERAKVAATGQAAIAVADSKESSAEAASAAATERQQTALEAADKMRVRYEARAADAEAAAQEAKFRAEATRTLAEESAVKEAQRRSAEEQMQSATAAIRVHREQAAQRKRAIEAELARARQRTAAASSLRDVQSRASVDGQHREHFAAARGAAVDLARELTAAVQEVLKRQAESEAADEARCRELTITLEEAATYLAECDHVLASIKTRLAERELQARKAAASYASNAAVAAAAKEEYELLSNRATNTLSKDASRCDAEAARARESAAAVRKRAHANEAPLKHQEEGEVLALERLKEAEAQLAQALSQARGASSVVGSLEPADDDDKECDPQAVKLIAKAMRQQQGKKEAREAMTREPRRLGGCGVGGGADADGDPCRLETIQEAEDEEDEEAAAAEEASAEARSRLRRPTTTAQLARRELAVVEAQILLHGEREDAARAEAARMVAEWQEQKKGLLVSLHVADLEVTSAKEDMTAMSELRASSPVTLARMQAAETVRGWPHPVAGA